MCGFKWFHLHPPDKGTRTGENSAGYVYQQKRLTSQGKLWDNFLEEGVPYLYQRKSELPAPLGAAQQRVHTGKGREAGQNKVGQLQGDYSVVQY